MKTPAIALLSFLLVAGMVVAPSQASPLSSEEPALAKSRGSMIELIDLPDWSVTSGKPVRAKYSRSGTIEDVDPAGLKVTILTDLGLKESLPITKVAVLVGVGPGDYVNCEMNADGKVTKMVKITPMPKGSPAPEPQG
jgi:hypothetical protein